MHAYYASDIEKDPSRNLSSSAESALAPTDDPDTAPETNAVQINRLSQLSVICSY